MSTTQKRRFQKFNPATETLIAEYEAVGGEAVAAAIRQARQNLEVWKKTPLELRVRVLKRMARLLYDRAEALAAVISGETGKPLGDALDADIGTALNVLNYYAEIGPARLRPRALKPDLLSRITLRGHRETYHPRGVIGIISPWNYPLAIPASGIAAALMAGNAVILKPSELAPATGQALVALAREALESAGQDPDTIQVLIGDGQTGADLVAGNLDGVIFTGSGRTGRVIREALAARGTWNSMELGGSDAMIVLEDCAPETAASYALWGRFTNAGQACASVKRLFVPRKQYESVLGLLREKMERLQMGPPEDPAAHVGPLISRAQLDFLAGQVQDAVSRGARLLVGGRRADRPGWFFEPTLLADVPKEARILRDEAFGPVLPVIPYDHVDEAIAQANASEFGLTASLFGPESQARRLAGQLECGSVVINDVGASNYAMACAPWGGWKGSGSGSSHGERALLELSRIQVVSVNGLFGIPGFNKPLWHFSADHTCNALRSRAVLAFSGRHPQSLNPATWLAFWHHRAGKKL